MSVTTLPDSLRDKLRQQVKQLLSEEVAQEASYRELLTDSLASPRLSDWEYKFLRNLETGRVLGVCTKMVQLSVKQLKVLKDIEKKVYAIG